MNPQTQMLEFTFERVIPAPVDDVFDAWLDPAIAGKPWHDAAKLIFTPEVDGLFYFMTNRNDGGPRECPGRGTEIPHYGRFIEIDRRARHQRKAGREARLFNVCVYDPRSTSGQVPVRSTNPELVGSCRGRLRPGSASPKFLLLVLLSHRPSQLHRRKPPSSYS